MPASKMGGHPIRLPVEYRSHYYLQAFLGKILATSIAPAPPQAFQGQLARGEVTFAELAGKESHCSSAQRGGDLGEFG